MKAVLISAVVALVIGLLGTPAYIKFLVRRGYGQFIRDDGPTSHHTKRGTPTMGGTVIIAATLIGYFAAHALTVWQVSASGLLVLFLMAGLGLVGFLDDYIKISRQRSLGLRPAETRRSGPRGDHLRGPSPSGSPTAAGSPGLERDLFRA